MPTTYETLRPLLDEAESFFVNDLASADPESAVWAEIHVGFIRAMQKAVRLVMPIELIRDVWTSLEYDVSDHDWCLKIDEALDLMELHED